MAIKTLYLTIQEANTILALDTIWIELTDNDIKSDALLWGRYYIDTEYTCNTFDEDTAPDEIKYANAYLAADYITNSGLYEEDFEFIKEKRVKAGSVETETKYSSPSIKVPKCIKRVDALLKEICYRSSLGSSVSLVRR